MGRGARTNTSNLHGRTTCRNSVISMIHQAGTICSAMAQCKDSALRSVEGSLDVLAITKLSTTKAIVAPLF